MNMDNIIEMKESTFYGCCLWNIVARASPMLPQTLERVR